MHGGETRLRQAQVISVSGQQEGIRTGSKLPAWGALGKAQGAELHPSLDASIKAVIL